MVRANFLRTLKEAEETASTIRRQIKTSQEALADLLSKALSTLQFSEPAEYNYVDPERSLTFPTELRNHIKKDRTVRFFSEVGEKLTDRLIAAGVPHEETNHPKYGSKVYEFTVAPDMDDNALKGLIKALAGKTRSTIVKYGRPEDKMRDVKAITELAEKAYPGIKLGAGFIPSQVERKV